MKTPEITSGNECALTRVIRLEGDVMADDYGPWMERHAKKLNVGIEITLHNAHEIRVLTKGPSEMVDAFALAASLGPRSVSIDKLEILAQFGED